MSLGHIKIDEVGKWPAAIVAQHKGLILKTMRVAVRVNAPGLIQAAIASYPRQPVHTGDYKRSWKIKDIDNGVIVYNPTLQAGIIEHGRRPGFGVSRSGIDAIARWVHLHGMDKVQVSRRERAIRRRMRLGGSDKAAIKWRGRWQQENLARSIAFAIALSIKRRGLSARPVIGPATELIKRVVVTAIDQAVRGAK